MHGNRHTLVRLAAALAAVLPGAVLATTGAASAAPTLVPATAVYALGGPDTPLPMSHTIAFDTTALVVSAEGLVASITCPAGLIATVAEGAGTITTDGGGPIAASTTVDCTVSLALGDVAPTSVTVAVSERDEFNAELATESQAVALEQLDVTATAGAVTLTGGTYQPAEPRSIGDELTVSYTFELLAARSMSFDVPVGTAMTGCAAQTAAAVTCTMTRTLSLADLADGGAAMAPTLLVDGFPVARPADLAVPSERRLGVVASASPAAVRVGEPVAVEAVVTNLGTIELSTLALSGAGITAASCGGVDPSTLTLAPGESVVCSAGHVATTADVGAVGPVVVRATAPFGADSDLVDDDPTSATDVDAASIAAPYSVAAAEIASSLSFGSGVAFVDDAGTDTLPLTLSVSTAGALTNAAVALPVAPFAGVSLVGCDQLVTDRCVISLGAMVAGSSLQRTVDVVVDPAGLPGAGIDGGAVGGTLTADGGISIDLSPAALRTAGLSTTVLTSVVEASGSTAVVDVELDVAAGHPVSVTISPSTGRVATVTACSDGAGSPVLFATSASGALLGDLAGGTALTCTLRQDVIDADRTSGVMPVDLKVVASAGSAELERAVHADLATIALVVEPTAPSPPPHGYSLDGSDGRPDELDYEFDLIVYGDVTVGGTLPFEATIDGTDDYRCEPVAGSDPVRIGCTGTHEITAEDLEAATYSAAFEASVGASAGVGATIEIPIPYEELEVLVTELSNPAGSGGYVVGETIRLLLQLRNTGTVAIELESLDSSLPMAIGSAAHHFASAPAGCSSGSELAAGGTLDCDIDLTVPAGFGGSSVTLTVVTAQLGVTEYTIVLAFDPTGEPMAEPTPAAPEPAAAASADRVPPTGSSTRPLLATAFGLCLVGYLLIRASRTAAVAPI